MNYNHTCFCTVLLFCILNIHAQKEAPYKYELELNTDNDAFIIWENFDRFYTYGAGLKLNFKTEHLLGLENLFSKKTNYFFSAGFRTEGYAPTKQIISIQELGDDTMPFDRPFAGLFFGTFDATYLFKQSFFKAQLYIGIMGPSAKSQEIQDWFHKNITDDDLIEGWNLQIPNQLILNVNASYTYDFMPNATFIDVFGMIEARLGNMYIDATPALNFRIGKFGPLNTSSALGNGLIANRGIREIFIKSSFSASFVAFNGTAQGPLFNNDYENSVTDLNPVHTSMSHGIFFTGKRFAFGYDNIFTFGKVNAKERHIYGRFSFLYRF